MELGIVARLVPKIFTCELSLRDFVTVLVSGGQ